MFVKYLAQCLPHSRNSVTNGDSGGENVAVLFSVVGADICGRGPGI